MTIDEFAGIMQNDILNEYTHMLFYMHASFMLNGPERLYVVPWLTGQANSEMTHIKQFADKIRSLGYVPSFTNGWCPPNGCSLNSLKEILAYALELESTVVANYHLRLKQAQELSDSCGKYYDLVLFYEEQLEHSQEDIDEIVKLLETAR